MSASKERASKTTPSRERAALIRRIILWFTPLMMVVMGAWLAMTSADNAAQYTDAVIGGLMFALAPIGAALILTVVVRLVTWPFRSRD